MSSWNSVPANSDELTRIVWHEQSHLLIPSGIAQGCAIPAREVDGVHFISDHNSQGALLAIKHAIESGVEFCVVNEQVESLSASSPAVTDETNANAYLQCSSSGSDGEPKRIRRSHLSWINSFRVTALNAKLTTTDSYALIGKLSHSLTLYAALEAAWIGADIHALGDLRVDKHFSAIQKMQSTLLYATPTQLRLLCTSAGNKDNEGSVQRNLHVKHIFSGGGKLDQNTHGQLTQHFPNALVKEFYGSSETSFITISDHSTPPDSVGRLYPGVELIIANNRDKTDQPSTDEAGELWVKSPYLFESYGQGNSGDTQWQDDYLSIGELGRLDKDGYLYLMGRRSRAVNIADNIVYPEVIEHFLRSEATIRQCALIPEPDIKRGSSLIAIVEAPENESMRLQLLKACRKKFGALHSPRKIIFVESIPMLASGKPNITAIQNQFAPPKANSRNHD